MILFFVGFLNLANVGLRVHQDIVVTNQMLLDGDDVILLPVATIRINSFLFGGSGDTDTYQVDSALRTLTSGGLFGTGFGKGMQQYGFLPFPYSDFIGSNIGEEWGFLGVAFVLVSFGLIFWRLVRIADRSVEGGASYLGVGARFGVIGRLQ